ncbi:MAG: O-antigen ligase family protein [Proteobacteria bacterium]|nr:O-antigen ligase family protein [Pseudomonadota bacterium]
MFLITLFWAPFPLGSNRAWSWSLLALLVTLCWLIWTASTLLDEERSLRFTRKLWPPAILAALALGWAIIQVLPWLPLTFAHPIWAMTSDVLARAATGSISIDPWRSTTEVMKLGTYAMACFLAFSLTNSLQRAGRLLDALIFCGAFYAAYGLCLAFFHLSQFELFYSAPNPGNILSAPFVNRNSYATYSGLISLCATARLLDQGANVVATRRGWRQVLLALMHFLFGRGTPMLLAVVLTLSTLIATGSLAGFLSTLAAMAGMLLLSSFIVARKRAMGWTAAAAVVLLVGGIALFAVNGGELETRLDTIAATGMAEDMRMLLWDSASRMIASSPWSGLGLGTFENAYPLYSDHMLPYVMDKVHNDYLELAAGWGLPAAILWWAALVWLAGICVRGVLVRRRHRIYPLLGVGASVLVGVHEVADFSLQIPAVALTYSAILGLGISQAFRTREDADGLSAGGSPDGSASSRSMGRHYSRLALIVPALLIAMVAIPRLASGLALEAAFPVPTYMAMNVSLPPNSYSAAADVLVHADPSDGEAQIARGEAVLLSHRKSLHAAESILSAGLAEAPMSARGWTLLAMALGPDHPQRAAAALDLAFELAPHDFWLVGLREKAGAPIVPYLSQETRAALFRETLLLWSDPQFHPLIDRLLREKGAPQMFGQAFASQPDELRALNRMIARERLNLPAGR